MTGNIVRRMHHKLVRGQLHTVGRFLGGQDARVVQIVEDHPRKIDRRKVHNAEFTIDLFPHQLGNGNVASQCQRQML